MKPFIHFFKYDKDKSLGINLCYQECEKADTKENKLLILKYKEIYINICLIWFNISIGLRTKPKNEGEIYV